MFYNIHCTCITFTKFARLCEVVTIVTIQSTS